MSHSLQPLDQLIEDVINASNMQCGYECSDDLRDAFNAIAEHPRAADSQPIIAERLCEVESASGAGLLAVWLGAGVEGGANPDTTGRPVLDTLMKWAATVETIDADEEANENEDEECDGPAVDPDTVAGMELLGQGLVAHVSRSGALHDQIANDPRIISELERVEHISAGPMWVLELIRKRSGTLLVIHVEQRRGFRMKYENLSNCFHLFTLLQDAIAGVKLPGSQRPSEELIAVAKGQRAAECYDDAWFHYGIGTHPSADLGTSVWGEASPDSIPTVDGQQVLLLWPPIMASRGWGAGFFGPFLMARPPAVILEEELPAAEVQHWCKRLKLPDPVASPWWKFW